MSEGEKLRDARLDAVAGVRAILAGDEDGLGAVLAGSSDPHEVAHAAMALAAAVLSMTGTAAEVLDAATAAALGPDGARP